MGVTDRIKSKVGWDKQGSCPVIPDEEDLASECSIIEGLDHLQPHMTQQDYIGEAGRRAKRAEDERIAKEKMQQNLERECRREEKRAKKQDKLKLETQDEDQNYPRVFGLD